VQLPCMTYPTHAACHTVPSRRRTSHAVALRGRHIHFRNISVAISADEVGEPFGVRRFSGALGRITKTETGSAPPHSTTESRGAALVSRDGTQLGVEPTLTSEFRLA
jgi:hypothetical protein